MKILIIGAGQVGYFLCDRLSQEGHEVTLIDQSEEKIERAQDRLNVMGVTGNGASAEILEQAGITDTDIFIAVTDFDEVNILACLLAREYQVSTRIARTKSIEYQAQQAVLSKEKLGIDLLINPEDAVAAEMIRITCSSGTFDVAEFAEGQIQFHGYRIDQDSPLCNLSLMELGELRGIYRFVVVAIHRKEETIIPHGEDVIQAGDRIYLFAHQKDLPAIQYMLQTNTAETRQEKRRARRSFILGGGRIGLQIAQGLESLNFQVKLIERNEDRCQKLAEKLDKTVVLHAEGSDIQTLKDEGIENSDVFIAVTDNDETNILTCLLARQNGVQRTLALVSQPELIDLASDLGIDACISPRLAAAATILKFIRRGDIISLATIEGSNSEVFELQVREHSGILNTPLRDLHFPRGALIGAIVRGSAYEIPTGESVLLSGDRVVIFALPGALAKVERFFD